MNALQRSIPIVYIILILNTASLAYSHYGAGPALVTLAAPAAIIAIMIARLIYWSLPKPASIKLDQTRKAVRAATIVA